MSSKLEFAKRYVTLEGRAYHLFNNARQRARKKGLSCEIDMPWVLKHLQRGVCWATGLPFVLEYGGGPGTARAFAPSIDRRNPKLGYTKDNTQVVCWMYNCAKGIATHEDVVRMSRAVVANSHA